MTAQDVVHGIDFGTSTSALMIGWANGAMRAVGDPADGDGSASVPSSVCRLRDGDLLVGSQAERAKYGRGNDYRAEFKREFGARGGIPLGDRHYLPHELAADVLRLLRDQALLLVPAEPVAVTIGVPALWEQSKRELLRTAAELAGYRKELVRVAPEPVAAAAHVWAVDMGNTTAGPEVTAPIYDLGGGTFDCAVATGDGADFTVIGAPDGAVDVGGVEFDRRIQQYLLDSYPEHARLLLDPARSSETAVLRRRIELRDDCEKIKIALSAAASHTETLFELTPPVDVTLTRKDLAELIDPLLDETVDVCERLLGSVDLDWSDVDWIVPVGGSSRLTLVGDVLARRANRPVLAVGEPESAVVAGATRLAIRDAWPRAKVTPPKRTPQAAAPPAAKSKRRLFRPDRDLFQEGDDDDGSTVRAINITLLGPANMSEVSAELCYDENGYAIRARSQPVWVGDGLVLHRLLLKRFRTQLLRIRMISCSDAAVESGSLRQALAHSDCVIVPQGNRFKDAQLATLIGDAIADRGQLGWAPPNIVVPRACAGLPIVASPGLTTLAGGQRAHHPLIFALHQHLAARVSRQGGDAVDRLELRAAKAALAGLAIIHNGQTTVL